MGGESVGSDSGVEMHLVATEPDGLLVHPRQQLAGMPLPAG